LRTNWQNRTSDLRFVVVLLKKAADCPDSRGACGEMQRQWLSRQSTRLTLNVTTLIREGAKDAKKRCKILIHDTCSPSRSQPVLDHYRGRLCGKRFWFFVWSQYL